MISINKAYEILSETKGAEPRCERVKVVHASGRFLANPIYAPLDLPPFHQSAMDGFAMSSFSTAPTRRIWKEIIGAGDHGDLTLSEEEAVKIMTGARLPQGADRVEMIEKVEIQEDHILMEKEPDLWQHVRQQGSHVGQGDLVFSTGTRLDPAKIGALASLGFAEVNVFSKLTVLLASTGNELSQPGESLGRAGIYDSNRLQLRAQLSDLPLDISFEQTISDDMDSLVDFLRTAKQDVIILTGGVSMGDFDLVPQAALAAEFECLFHKIQMKPGKPIWFGKRGNQILFGLPGNPVSTFVGCQLYVRPWLKSCFEGSFSQPKQIPVKLAKSIQNKGKFTFFAPFKWSEDAIEPIQTKGSGDVIRFAHLNGLIIVPPHTTLQPGEIIRVLLL